MRLFVVTSDGCLVRDTFAAAVGGLACADGQAVSVIAVAAATARAATDAPSTPRRLITVIAAFRHRHPPRAPFQVRRLAGALGSLQQGSPRVLAWSFSSMLLIVLALVMAGWMFHRAGGLRCCSLRSQQ